MAEIEGAPVLAQDKGIESRGIRGGDDEQAAGREQSIALFQECARIEEVLDDLVAGKHVEGAISDLDLIERLLQRFNPFFAAVPCQCGVRLDRYYPTKCPRLPDLVAKDAKPGTHFRDRAGSRSQPPAEIEQSTHSGYEYIVAPSIFTRWEYVRAPVGPVLGFLVVLGEVLRAWPRIYAGSAAVVA